MTAQRGQGHTDNVGSAEYDQGLSERRAEAVRQMLVTRPAWTAAERESFFDAIARHRRASWRVAVASGLANIVVAFIVAALMAPLLYAIPIFTLDIVNLVHRTPDAVRIIMHAIDPLMSAPHTVPIGRWLYLGLLAALPGLVLMGFVLLALRRALVLSATFDGGALPARLPDPQVLDEQRLGNVVGEMALAANLPVPRVLIVDRDVLNAAVFGRDEQHATLVISQPLLSLLDRGEMQGVAAHLVGSIANGDMAIGLGTARTLSLFGVISRLSDAIGNRAALRPLARLMLAALHPTASNAQTLMLQLTDPFGAEDASTERSTTVSATDPPEPAWRTWARMPLAGPLAITGFFCGTVSMFLLGPLLALAWRRRKYMADATAVRLTRDPDSLAHALEKMGYLGSKEAFAPWAAHLSVIDGPTKNPGITKASVVPMFPSSKSRLRALALLGAHLSQPPRRMSGRIWLFLGPLLAIFILAMGAILYLLVIVSVALSGMFTWIPLVILHVLLRAI